MPLCRCAVHIPFLCHPCRVHSYAIPAYSSSQQDICYCFHELALWLRLCLCITFGVWGRCARSQKCACGTTAACTKTTNTDKKNCSRRLDFTCWWLVWRATKLLDLEGILPFCLRANPPDPMISTETGSRHAPVL